MEDPESAAFRAVEKGSETKLSLFPKSQQSSQQEAVVDNRPLHVRLEELRKKEELAWVEDRRFSTRNSFLTIRGS